MNDDAYKSPSTMLAAGGAGFLALATVFLVRDLDLPAEAVLLVAAMLASSAAILQRPRRWPWLAPAALLALAVVGGAWYAAVSSPALLPALAITMVGSVMAVVHRERTAPRRPSPLADRLAWYGAGASFLAASGAFYFRFFTVGEEWRIMQMVPTIAWLAVGLALLIAARGRSRGFSPPRQVAVALGAIALLKALVYDSTHLQGPMRVTIFAAVGALLLAGARLVSDGSGTDVADDAAGEAR
jgi:ribose/xylose/arabinose/galactoside ABC-type transport system permease subunit